MSPKTMNYTINKTYLILSVAFMLAFGMFMVVTPAQAHGCDSYGGCGSYQYNSNYCDRFGSCNTRPQYPVYQPPVYQQPPVYYPPTTYYQALSVSCSPNTTSGYVGTSVTWSAYATGGNGNYTYSWTGSDALTGTAKSVIKTYSTTGEKNAIVTVTSADGKTGTRSCTNTLAVRGTGAGSNIASSNTKTTVSSNTTTAGNSLSAASLFSLGNVPWGWIAILIILLLFATVLYLVFNKSKI